MKRSIVLLHGVVSSQLTWWRLKLDLENLGWQVHAVDMLGHGSRHAAGPDEPSTQTPLGASGSSTVERSSRSWPPSSHSKVALDEVRAFVAGPYQGTRRRLY